MTARLTRSEEITSLTPQNKQLCDKCHERPATCHICYGHPGETENFCETCSTQTTGRTGFQQRLDELIRSGDCKFCGAPAKTGSFSFSSVFGEESELWCSACREDLVEFTRRPENSLAGDFPFADEAAQRGLVEQMADLEHRKEKFMRGKISERRRKSDG
jgi:hypothetical protein